MNEPENPRVPRRRSIRRLIFGSSTAFGRRETRFGKWRRFGLLALVVLSVIGVVIALSTIGSFRSESRNTARVLVEENSFDPIKDYADIRDNGTIDQLRTLLVGLRDRNLAGKVPAIRLDNDRKLIEIADLMLAHPDLDEEQRVLAAKTKINGWWNFYMLNMLSGNVDPSITDQLFLAADQFLDDPDPAVARDAHLAKCMGLVGETARQRFVGEIDNVEQAISTLLSRFPDDSSVLQNLGVMFSRIRDANEDYATRLSERITPLLDRSDAEATREFSRFIKDVDLLYDAGIGNATNIDSIKVGYDEFMRRLDQLNENLDAGVTVIAQLDNAMEFLERNRKYTLALELSRKILENSSARTNQAAAALAHRVGTNGITRNLLLQQPWSFEEIDIHGKQISSDRFHDQVTAVVFLSSDDPRSNRALKALKELGNLLFGKEFSLIFVEYDASPGKSNPVSPEVDRWVTLRTTAARPNRYLQQCPTNRFPYLILIDRNGDVDSINVSPSDIKTRVEQLLSKQ